MESNPFKEWKNTFNSEDLQNLDENDENRGLSDEQLSLLKTSLSKTIVKTSVIVDLLKSGNTSKNKELDRILNLRLRLKRVVPVIPSLLGEAYAMAGEGLDNNLMLPFGLLPKLPPTILPPPPGGKGPLPQEQEVRVEEPAWNWSKLWNWLRVPQTEGVTERVTAGVSPGLTQAEELAKAAEQSGRLTGQVDQLLEALEKQRQEDTNEVRSGTDIKVPETQWNKIPALALLSRINYELVDGQLGEQNLPPEIWVLGSAQNLQAIQILESANLTVPDVLRPSSSTSSSSTSQIIEGEVNNDWMNTASIVVQLVLMIAATFVDGPAPVGDAAALANLVRMIKAGQTSRPAVMQIVRRFGLPRLTKFIKNYLDNALSQPATVSSNSSIRPTSFSMASAESNNDDYVTTLNGGGLLNSETTIAYVVVDSDTDISNLSSRVT